MGRTVPDRRLGARMPVKPLTVIGIDPGLAGALVCLRAGEVLACLDLPIESGVGNRNRLSAIGVDLRNK